MKKVQLLMISSSIALLTGCSEKGGYCETTTTSEMEYGEIVFKNAHTTCYDLDGNIKEEE